MYLSEPILMLPVYILNFTFIFNYVYLCLRGGEGIAHMHAVPKEARTEEGVRFPGFGGPDACWDMK